MWGQTYIPSGKAPLKRSLNGAPSRLRRGPIETTARPTKLWLPLRYSATKRFLQVLALGLRRIFRHMDM
jgi:hypothetical protein